MTPSTDLETTPGTLNETAGAISTRRLLQQVSVIACGIMADANEYRDFCDELVKLAEDATLTAPDDAGLVEALKTVDGDWKWLCNQLERWPTRVHPDRTTNMTYLHESAAKIIRAALTPGNQS